jgi:hypothetical protein
MLRLTLCIHNETLQLDGCCKMRKIPSSPNCRVLQGQGGSWTRGLEPESCGSIPRHIIQTHPSRNNWGTWVLTVCAHAHSAYRRNWIESGSHCCFLMFLNVFFFLFSYTHACCLCPPSNNVPLLSQSSWQWRLQNTDLAVRQIFASLPITTVTNITPPRSNVCVIVLLWARETKFRGVTFFSFLTKVSPCKQNVSCCRCVRVVKNNLVTFKGTGASSYHNPYSSSFAVILLLNKRGRNKKKWHFGLWGGPEFSGKESSEVRVHQFFTMPSTRNHPTSPRCGSEGDHEFRV